MFAAAPEIHGAPEVLTALEGHLRALSSQGGSEMPTTISTSDRLERLRRRIGDSLLYRLNAFQHIFVQRDVKAVDVHFQLVHAGGADNIR